MAKYNKIDAFKKIIQDEKNATAVTEDVISEICSLLDSTMSSKEMTRSEIINIADRLIEFQVKQKKTGTERT